MCESSPGAGGGKRGVQACLAGFGGHEDKDRPQPFAAGHEAISHRLGEPFGARFDLVNLGKKSRDRFLHSPTLPSEPDGRLDRFVRRNLGHL